MNSKTAIIALTKHNKPFRDGELCKEAFIIAREVLFQNFKNKSEIEAISTKICRYRKIQLCVEQKALVKTLMIC